MDPERHLVHLVDQDHPERLMAERDARRRLNRALDSLDPHKRALLTLFELENVPCAKLAELFGIPVGTVHSRLSAARQQFQQALVRLEVQVRHQTRVRGGRP